MIILSLPTFVWLSVTFDHDKAERSKKQICNCRAIGTGVARVATATPLLCRHRAAATTDILVLPATPQFWTLLWP